MQIHLPFRASIPKLLFRVFVVALFIIVFSNKAMSEWHYEEHYIFGTNVSIQLWSEDAILAKFALDRSVEEMWRIHNQLSPLIENTELSQLNLNAHPGPVKVSIELGRLIDKSLLYSRLSDGAFDITFASLGYLYDYRKGTKPSEAEIELLRESINYELIDYQPEVNEVRFLDENLKIDLGGIAKGYAIERVAIGLQKLGIEHATITAGGDSRVVGDKLGQPWTVGIRNPRSEETAIRIPLSDFAISTSGDYERFFIDPDSGERVHHILNPSTGTSAHDVASVSVMGPSGFDTDPLSTTLFVLGPEEGLRLIEQIEDYDAIFIDLEGKTHFSSGLEPPE